MLRVSQMLQYACVLIALLGASADNIEDEVYRQLKGHMKGSKDYPKDYGFDKVRSISSAVDQLFPRGANNFSNVVVKDTQDTSATNQPPRKSLTAASRVEQGDLDHTASAGAVSFISKEGLEEEHEQQGQQQPTVDEMRQQWNPRLSQEAELNNIVTMQANMSALESTDAPMYLSEPIVGDNVYELLHDNLNKKIDKLNDWFVSNPNASRTNAAVAAAADRAAKEERAAAEAAAEAPEMSHNMMMFSTEPQQDPTMSKLNAKPDATKTEEPVALTGDVSDAVYNQLRKNLRKNLQGNKDLKGYGATAFKAKNAPKKEHGPVPKPHENPNPPLQNGVVQEVKPVQVPTSNDDEVSRLRAEVQQLRAERAESKQTKATKETAVAAVKGAKGSMMAASGSEVRDMLKQRLEQAKKDAEAARNFANEVAKYVGEQGIQTPQFSDSDLQSEMQSLKAARLAKLSKAGMLNGKEEGGTTLASQQATAQTLADADKLTPSESIAKMSGEAGYILKTMSSDLRATGTGPTKSDEQMVSTAAANAAKAAEDLTADVDRINSMTEQEKKAAGVPNIKAEKPEPVNTKEVAELKKNLREAMDKENEKAKQMVKVVPQEQGAVDLPDFKERKDSRRRLEANRMINLEKANKAKAIHEKEVSSDTDSPKKDEGKARKEEKKDTSKDSSKDTSKDDKSASKPGDGISGTDASSISQSAYDNAKKKIDAILGKDRLSSPSASKAQEAASSSKAQEAASGSNAKMLSGLSYSKPKTQDPKAAEKSLTVAQQSQIQPAKPPEKVAVKETETVQVLPSETAGQAGYRAVQSNLEKKLKDILGTKGSDKHRIQQEMTFLIQSDKATSAEPAPPAPPAQAALATSALFKVPFFQGAQNMPKSPVKMEPAAMFPYLGFQGMAPNWFMGPWFGHTFF